MNGRNAGDAGETALRLNALLCGAGQLPLERKTANQFVDYLSLLMHWNDRINLSAVRDEEGILSRHFVESIVVARKLPKEIHTLLDFGSGAGLPGIPIALCRPEIAVTLAESQAKKAAFLREAVRRLGTSTKVHAGRAEALRVVFDCVTLRAVDRMTKAVAEAVGLLEPGGWLALMTTGAEVGRLQHAAGEEIAWGNSQALPRGNDRILVMGKRRRSGS